MQAFILSIFPNFSIPKKVLLRINSKKYNSIPFDLPDNVEEEGLIIELFGFKYSKLKCVLYFIASIFSLGFLNLICYWSLKCKIYFTMSKASVSELENLLIFCKG